MGRARTAALLAAALVVAACGNGDGNAGDSPSPDGPTDVETTIPPEDPTDGDVDLPGEVVEIHPYEGAELGVMGVAVDDVLHVRSGPGVEFESVVQLEPLATDVVATGHNRQVEDDSFWAQVGVDGVTGWASPAFLAYLGATTDVTSELTDLPTAPSPEGAGTLVAEQRMADTPPSARVVIVDGPHAGDLHEVVLDVIGLGDDALAGERLRVFLVEDGDGFAVRTVEATLLCARGVTDGLCL